MPALGLQNLQHDASMQMPFSSAAAAAAQQAMMQATAMQFQHQKNAVGHVVANPGAHMMPAGASSTTPVQ